MSVNEKNDNITLKDIIRQGKRKNKKINKNLIEKAYEYAEEKHRNQFRKSGEPYIIHPIHVAYIVAELGLDTQTICAALLHDVVEDTEATYEDIKKEFGQEIAQIVEGVTKIGSLFESVEKNQAENYKKMFIAVEKDIRVILLKLADRLHNVQTLQYLRRDRQIAIAKETIDLYAQIAHKLGMYEMKMKLQDNAFNILQPKEYQEIEEKLNKIYEEEKENLIKTKREIEQKLKKEKIVALLNIEHKHIYNIYKKVKEKEIKIDQIKDLFGLKILTRNKQECYRVLGVLNNNYNVIPNTFKDYIATPRNNMYQAIHEIILGYKGVIIEAQICSYDMNKLAKYGITNYFMYSEEETEFKNKLSGIYDTLELNKMTEDSNEFLSMLKSELLDEEVYIFTPKGEIKVLPKNSCAIDFAYLIHNEIGTHIKSCKINNINMPITTRLQNGNIVEIIVSEEECEPKKEWLDFIKTSKAKSQVIKMLKLNQIQEKSQYSVEILATDRNNLVLDITRTFGNNRLNILSLNTFVENNNAKIEIVMETRKTEKLDRLTKDLYKIEGVTKVTIEEITKDKENNENNENKDV